MNYNDQNTLIKNYTLIDRPNDFSFYVGEKLELTKGEIHKCLLKLSQQNESYLSIQGKPCIHAYLSRITEESKAHKISMMTNFTLMVYYDTFKGYASKEKRHKFLSSLLQIRLSEFLGYSIIFTEKRIIFRTKCFALLIPNNLSLDCLEQYLHLIEGNGLSDKQWRKILKSCHLSNNLKISHHADFGSFAPKITRDIIYQQFIKLGLNHKKICINSSFIYKCSLNLTFENLSYYLLLTAKGNKHISSAISIYKCWIKEYLCRQGFSFNIKTIKIIERGGNTTTLIKLPRLPSDWNYNISFLNEITLKIRAERILYNIEWEYLKINTLPNHINLVNYMGKEIIDHLNRSVDLDDIINIKNVDRLDDQQKCCWKMFILDIGEILLNKIVLEINHIKNIDHDAEWSLIRKWFDCDSVYVINLIIHCMNKKGKVNITNFIKQGITRLKNHSKIKEVISR